jgi:hypothetical protein
MCTIPKNGWKSFSYCRVHLFGQKLSFFHQYSDISIPDLASCMLGDCFGGTYLNDNSFNFMIAEQQDFDLCTVFGLRDSGLFHWRILYLVYGLYWSTQVSSLFIFYQKTAFLQELV